MSCVLCAVSVSAGSVRILKPLWTGVFEEASSLTAKWTIERPSESEGEVVNVHCCKPHLVQWYQVMAPGWNQKDYFTHGFMVLTGMLCFTFT